MGADMAETGAKIIQGSSSNPQIQPPGKKRIAMPRLPPNSQKPRIHIMIVFHGIHYVP